VKLQIPPTASRLRARPRPGGTCWLLGSIASLLGVLPVAAVTYYWDGNGSTTGASNAPSGTWGTSVFWSTSSVGTSATANTTTDAFSDLIFSAGTDATGAYTVTLNGTQTARTLTIEEGTPTFSGGTLILAGGGGLTLNAGAGNAVLSSNLILSGGQTLNVGTGRILTLNTGAFTRNLGATLNVQGAGVLSSSMAGFSANTSAGIVGAWASFGTGTSTRYAVFSGSNVVGLTGTAAATASALTDTTGLANYDLAAVTGGPAADFSANTLRYTGAAGSLILGATRFAVNGVLNAGTGLLTLAGNPLTIGADRELVVNAANNAVTIFGVIQDNAGGASALTKMGANTLTLSGANTYSGVTTVSQGVLTVAHDAALGAVSGNTVVYVTGATGTGGKVALSGNLNLAENFVLHGTTDQSPTVLAIEAGAGTQTLTGSITLSGTGAFRLGNLAGSVLNLNGQIARNGANSGALLFSTGVGSTVNVAQPMDLNGGQLSLTGSGTLVLGASGNDIGATQVYSGGASTVLKLGVHDALNPLGDLTLGSTTSGSDQGGFDLAGFQQTLKGLIGSRASSSPSGSSTRRIFNSAAGTTSTLTLGNGAATTTFDGVFQDGAGTLALTKVGTGTQTLAGDASSTATGDVTIRQGTLALSFANTGVNAVNLLSSGVALKLGQGVAGTGAWTNPTLSVTSKAAQTNSQTFAGTELAAARNAQVTAVATGTGLTIDFGAITRNAASTLNLTRPASGATFKAVNGNDATGIVGTWLTTGVSGVQGSDWVTKDGSGNLVPYTGYTTVTGATPLIANSPGAHVNLTGLSATATLVGAGITDVATIKYSDAAARTLEIGANNTLRLGADGAIFRSDTTTVNVLTIGSATSVVGDGLTAGGAPDTAGQIHFITNNNNANGGGAAVIVNSEIKDNGTGAVSVLKSGQGILQLSGANTYSGGTVVTGRSRIYTNSSTGLGSGPVTVHAGAVVQILSTSVANSLTIAGLGATDNAGYGALLLQSATVGNSFTTLTLVDTARIGSANSAGTIASAITGAASLELTNGSTGTSTLTLSNPGNNWTGNLGVNGLTTAVNNGGTTLKLGASEVLPNGAGKGNLILTGGATSGVRVTLDLNGFNETINGLFSGGTLAQVRVTNNAAGTGTATLTVGDNDVSSAFGGSILDGATAKVALTKTGAGTLTLSGANSFTGTTTPAAGTLRLAHQNALQGSLVAADAGNLVFDSSVSGNAFIFGGLSEGTGYGLSLQNNAATPAPVALTVGANNQNAVYAGNLTGSGSLIKTGSGVQTLAGVNTYTGTTTINEGALSFANPAAIYNGLTTDWTPENIVVNDGSTFGVRVGGPGEFSEADVSLLLSRLLSVNNNGLKAGACFGFDTTNFPGGLYSFSGSLADSVGPGGGAVGLAKLGNNTLLLTGTASYTGPTRIYGGVLALGADGVLPAAGAVILQGGQLDLGGLEKSAGALSITNAAVEGDTILNGNLTAASYAASLVSGNAVVSANLGGAAATFLKTGAGTLTFTGENTYGGGTTVSAGVLQLGNGSLVGDIVNNASLISANTAAQAVGGGISGTGSLLKTGTGTLTVAGAVTGQAGGFAINQGTVRLASAANVSAPLNFGDQIGVTTVGGLDLSSAGAVFTGLTAQTYSESPGTVTIGDGKALVVNGNVIIGKWVSGYLGETRLSISGPGAFEVNAPGGKFYVGGDSSATSGRAVLDLAGLGSFTANLAGGTLALQTASTPAVTSVTGLYLSDQANTITAGALSVGAGGVAAIHELRLGAGSNRFNVDALNIGNGGRDSGRIDFGGSPAGELTVRNSTGTGRAALNIGAAATPTGARANNFFDTTGHFADLLLSQVSMSTNAARTGGQSSTFSFDQGILDLTTLTMAKRSVANGGTNAATFNIGGGTVTMGALDGVSIAMASSTVVGGTAAATVNLTGGVTTLAGNIVVLGGVGTFSGTLNLSGGTLDMGGNAIGDAVNPVSFNASAGELRNVGSINGGGGLIKIGDGTLTLSGVNTYAGPTQVQAGVLGVASPASLGVSGSVILVADGGTLELRDGIAVSGRALSLDGTGGSFSGALRNRNGESVFAGPITLESSAAIQSDAGTLTLSGGITGEDRNLVIQGAGNVTLSGSIATGAGSLSKTGAGVLRLQSSNTWSGATQILQGKVLLDGCSLGSTAVTVGTGSPTSSEAGHAVLEVLGNTTLGTESGGSLLVSGGKTGESPVGQGTLSLQGGALNTLTLANTTPGATNLALGGAAGNAAVLKLDIGPAGTDRIAVGQRLSLNAGGAVVSLNPLSGPALGLGTYDLITYTSGSSLIGAFSFAGGLTKVAWGGGRSLSLQTTATAAQLVVATVDAPANAYWKGGQSGVWTALDGGNQTNWIDAAAGVETQQLPGLTTNVFFTAGAAGNLNTALGRDFSINSLNFTGTGTAAEGAVTITGNRITLFGTASHGNAAGNAISVASGSGPHVIQSDVFLGGNQVWKNASVNPLTLSGSIGGGFTLDLEGAFVFSGTSANTAYEKTTVRSGTLTLAKDAGVNAVAGELLVNGGTVQWLASEQIADSSKVTVDGGALALGSHNETVGELHLRTGAITGGALSAATYTVESGAISAALGNAGASFLKTGSGTVALSGANTFAGGARLEGGTVHVQVSNAGAVSGAFGPSIQSISVHPVQSDTALLLNGAYTLANPIAVSAADGAGVTLGGAHSTGVGVFSGDIALGRDMVLASAGGDVEFRGAFSGTGGATVRATTGRVLLNGAAANTHTGLSTLESGTLVLGKTGGALAVSGDLTVSGGRLELAENDQIADTATLRVNAGTVDVGGFTDTVKDLVISGGMVTSAGGGALRIVSGVDARAGVLDVGIAGSVPLAKTTGGVTELRGSSANTFTGLTTVGAGTLLLNKDAGVTAITGDGVANAGTPDVVIRGGTLKSAANGQLDPTLTLLMTSGGLNLNGKTETIFDFTNRGGVFRTGAGGNLTVTSLNTTTWSGGSNTVNTGGSLTTPHLVIRAGVNGVETGGVLNVGNGAAAGGALEFSNGGSLALQSGPGAAGKLALTDDVTVTGLGGSVVSTGAGANPGTVDLGGKRLVTVSGDAEFLIGASLANGSLRKTGTGTLTLSGANTHAGGTVIDAGTVALGHARALGTGDVRLDNATLRMSGDSLQARIGGNYIQGAGGALQLRVNRGPGGALLSDSLLVTGRAELGGTLQITSPGRVQLRLGERVTLLEAEAGVSGAFSEIRNGLVSNTIVRPTVTQESQAVVLEGELGSFAQHARVAGLTLNQRATASALDRVALDPRETRLIGAVSEVPLQTLPSALDRIAPEELSAVYQQAVASARTQSWNLQQRLREARGGWRGFSAGGLRTRDGRGDSKTVLGGAVLGGAGGANLSARLADLMVSQGKEIADAGKPWTFFINGELEWVDIDSTANARGYDLQSAGVSVGADVQVNEHLVAGLTTGYSRGDVELAGGGRMNREGGSQFGAYTSYFRDGFHVDGIIGGGVNDYEIRRAGLGGNARGDTDGREFHMELSAGKDWRAGGLTFGPEAALRYTWAGLEGYTERGSLAPLRIESQDAHSLQFELGGHVAYAWKMGALVVTPEVRMFWQHETLEDSPWVASRFASGAGGVFRVRGPRLGRDSLVGSGSVTVQMGEKWSGYAAYSGEFLRTNTASHRVNLGLRMEF
jgi:fibronectin-binding autotransporter adhesin